MPSWLSALKIWNKGTGKWCIPKKGTPEYDEVLKIMGLKLKKDVKKPRTKKPRAKKTIEQVIKEMESKSKSIDRGDKKQIAEMQKIIANETPTKKPRAKKPRTKKPRTKKTIEQVIKEMESKSKSIDRGDKKQIAEMQKIMANKPRAKENQKFKEFRNMVSLDISNAINMHKDGNKRTKVYRNFWKDFKIKYFDIIKNVFPSDEQIKRIITDACINSDKKEPVCFIQHWSTRSFEDLRMSLMSFKKNNAYDNNKINKFIKVYGDGGLKFLKLVYFLHEWRELKYTPIWFDLWKELNAQYKSLDIWLWDLREKNSNIRREKGTPEYDEILEIETRYKNVPPTKKAIEQVIKKMERKSKSIDRGDKKQIAEMQKIMGLELKKDVKKPRTKKPRTKKPPTKTIEQVIKEMERKSKRIDSGDKKQIAEMQKIIANENPTKKPPTKKTIEEVIKEMERKSESIDIGDKKQIKDFEELQEDDDDDDYPPIDYLKRMVDTTDNISFLKAFINSDLKAMRELLVGKPTIFLRNFFYERIHIMMTDTYKDKWDKYPEFREDVTRFIKPLENTREKVQDIDDMGRIIFESKEVKNSIKDVKELINNLQDEAIETTDIIIQDAPVEISKKKAYNIEDCLIKVNGILDIMYGTKQLTFDSSIMEKLKIKRDLQNIIEDSDFYPTPPKYANIIMDDVVKVFKDVEKWVDIAAGLGSLSMPAIEGKYPESLNIENIIMFEKQKPFVDVLKCFEGSGFVKVKDGDYFEYDISEYINDKEETVIVSNPPFRGFFDGKNRSEFWAYFVYSILRTINNNKHYFYAILPNSNRFISSTRSKFLTDNDIGKQVSLQFSGKLWSDLKKYFKDESEDEFEIDEEYSYDYVTYITPVTGFKKIGKNGKPQNMGLNAVLVRFGI
jgi:hypothetical protein